MENNRRYKDMLLCDGTGEPMDGIKLEEIKERLKEALLKFDPEISSAFADFVVSDIIDTVDFDDPCIAERSFTWIAEHFYSVHYLHAGWS